ncbi:hypothetical protein ACFQL4_22555 [Halosimplex aquaticum]
MAPSLTYVQFHAVYVLPALAVLAATVHYRRDSVDWRVSGGDSRSSPRWR